MWIRTTFIDPIDHFGYIETMELVYYPHEVLRQKADPVESVNAEIRDLMREMVPLMERNRGVGLAAPQVGISQRFFVVKFQDDEPLFFINPEIIATSHETGVYEEGCLSLPGVWAEVVRPLAITVQAINLKGRPFRLKTDGFLARVIQHELDHLNGVLFTDRLAEAQRTQILELYLKKRSAS